jgi:4-amino-4-deoxychorismate lyase
VRNTSEVNGIRFKSHHYGNNVFARFELPSLATEEGIFLTEAGYVAEGITSNLFWVKNGKLYTPSIETNILAGITRKHVLQLAANLNIPIEQGLYEKEVLLRADEVFVTTSIQHIVPITKIERATYKGLNGFVTQKLQLAYEQMIEEEKVKEGDNDD